MEKQGKHRMSREEFIDRMQRDAIRKQTGDAESEQERKEREQREENERIRRHQAELNAYRSANIERFGHKLHLKDRKARIYGNQ
jgi:hypothetical protein